MKNRYGAGAEDLRFVESHRFGHQVAVSLRAKKGCVVAKKKGMQLRELETGAVLVCRRITGMAVLFGGLAFRCVPLVWPSSLLFPRKQKRYAGAETRRGSCFCLGVKTRYGGCIEDLCCLANHRLPFCCEVEKVAVADAKKVGSYGSENRYGGSFPGACFSLCTQCLTLSPLRFLRKKKGARLYKQENAFFFQWGRNTGIAALRGELRASSRTNRRRPPAVVSS